MRTTEPSYLRQPGRVPVDRKPEGAESGGPRHAGGAGENPAVVQPVGDRVTALFAKIRVTTYNEHFRQCGEREVPIGVIEDSIPDVVRSWLSDLVRQADKQPKEG